MIMVRFIFLWTSFSRREPAINPHISVCKPPLEENMVCGPINYFKNVYIGAQVQQACGPCKAGLVCKQVGWVFYAFLCFVLENKRAASGLFQAFMVGEERGKSYAGKARGKRGKSERLEQAAPQVSKNPKRCQEPITRSLHTHCILESGFAHIFLFLEQSQVSISRVFSPASARETKKKNR